MSRAQPKQLQDVDYVLLSRWRNGWCLIERDGQHYLRRAYRGQHKVDVVKTGFVTWRITDPVTGDRVDPARLR